MLQTDQIQAILDTDPLISFIENLLIFGYYCKHCFLCNVPVVAAKHVCFVWFSQPLVLWILVVKFS